MKTVKSPVLISDWMLLLWVLKGALNYQYPGIFVQPDAIKIPKRYDRLEEC